MKYSPKLKKAMQEIDEIMARHDIGGMVVLHTPGNGEHKVYVSPTYSCAFIDNTPGKESIRVRTRLQEDFNGDAQARHKCQEDTANMFDILSTLGGYQAMNIIKVFDMLKEPLGIISGPSSHTTDNEINN